MKTLAVLVIVGAAGCRATGAPGDPSYDGAAHFQPAAWMQTDVGAQEHVVGRVRQAGVVRLLTARRRIVTIDIRARTSSATPLIGLDDEVEFGGIAVGLDGTLLVLAGWRSLLRVGVDGTVGGREQLRGLAVGLHSGPMGPLFQPLDFAADGPALMALEGSEPRAWGRLRVIAGQGAGALRLAQSLISCSVPNDDEVACWLANSDEVEVGRSGGDVHLVRIPGLESWRAAGPEAFARHPRRIIRDVWLEGTHLWVLGPVDSPAQASLPGERGLWKLSRTGDVLSQVVLPVPARLLLGVDEGRVFVLSATGAVLAVGAGS
ncbi:MAG: hypothetical protein FJW23_03235 [Acidimicrobiia bacterium]|nr:hypothetical protein [Acidimicrobiia bacterium]